MADELRPPGDPIPDEPGMPRAREYARFQGMLLGTVAVVVGVFVLLTVVSKPGTWQPNLEENPTPNGYSIGMAIYLVPSIAGLYMLRQLRSFQLYQRSFVYALFGMFIPLLFLDVLFVGSSFFTFPNCGAYLGYIGAFDLVDWEWEPQSVPIEDVLFYFLALGCTLVVYLWSSLFWFPQASPYYRRGRLYRPRAWRYIRSWQPRWSALLVGVLLVGMGWALQLLMTETCSGAGGLAVLDRFCHQGGSDVYTCISGVPERVGGAEEAPLFPIYWTFLVLTAAIPTLVLGRRVGNLVNWPAFSFSFALMVLISVVLAVTTAVPYRWWAFETDVMIGFHFNTWFGIPLEQTFLYFITPWVAVLWLELVHAWRFRKLGKDDGPGPGYPTVDLGGDPPPVVHEDLL